jgi:hypothetical protein
VPSHFNWPLHSLRADVLDPGLWTSCGGGGSEDRFQEVRELRWQKNYNSIFINIGLKFEFQFPHGRKQQNNERPLDYKNIFFTNYNVLQPKHNTLNNVKLATCFGYK